MSWVHDRCDHAYIFPLDVERATGILTIHQSCDPPCPRRQAATAYMNTRKDEQERRAARG